MQSKALDRRAHPQAARFGRWPAPDGWTLRTMDWPQPPGTAARGSILFANGRGDFIEKYLEALAHWHGRGWNIRAFDWRGQGDSRGSIVGGHLDSFDPLIDDLDALAQAWLAETPGPHVLIGHSMGGHLVLRLLAERRPAVDAAVLSAPMVGINTAPLPAWVAGKAVGLLCRLGLAGRPAWRRTERPALRAGARQRWLTSCPDRYADETWWKERTPGFELGPPTLGWLAAAFRSMARVTPERLAQVGTPVLFIGTDTDRLVSAAAIRKAAAAMPKAELHMFANAGHEVLREGDPVRLEAFRRIDGFLDRHAR